MKRMSRTASFGSEERRQRQLAKTVIEKTPRDFQPALVCGLDAAYSNDVGIGVAAVWDCKLSKIVQVQSSHGRVWTEYRPGFFGLREGPLVLAAAGRLTVVPDAYLVDGHGRAHPRHFGIACRVGLALAKPTVGVAKSILYGKIVNNALMDEEGSVIARILKKDFARPYYVSVGHLISLEGALRLVKHCASNGGISPLRAAHAEAVRLIHGIN